MEENTNKRRGIMMNKLIILAVLIASVSVYAGNAESELAMVGFAKEIKNYCFENVDENGVLKDRSCRSLVITDGSTNGYQAFYERFQKWTFTENEKSLQIDAVTYFKNNQALFDQKYDIGKLHQVDLSYPENTDVQVEYDENSLPTISNLYLARFETADELGYAHVTIDYELDSIKMVGEYIIYKLDKNGNKLSNPQRFPIEDLYKSID